MKMIKEIDKSSKLSINNMIDKSIIEEFINFK